MRGVGHSRNSGSVGERVVGAAISLAGCLTCACTRRVKGGAFGGGCDDMTELHGIPGVYDTDLVNEWEDLTTLKQAYAFGEDRWIFRGQEVATWPLRSTCERSREGGGPDEPWKHEAAMLREFTRRAHQDVRDVPELENTLEWFALMRHFGAPTRLLDCT